MKKLFIVLFLVLSTTFLFAQKKRNALVIGIDTYGPPAGTQITGAKKVVENLNGCRNDARSMKSLVLNKFGFDKANVDSLYNQNATRAAILLKLGALLKKSDSGDVAFFFYAGHGSQQVNSLTKEEDKLDESIVPADTWKPGVADIRDKELAKIFNDFIDKGVNLTVILDCCHSGSMSRGGNPPQYYKPKTRYTAKNMLDAKDASQPQAPELRKERSFLILSAAQDDELAEESKDKNGKPHGAFTIALTEAINQQSVNASAINIFKSIGTLLKSYGKAQEPVLAGNIERQQQTLFGIAKGLLPDKTLIPIASVKNGRILLQGGFAEGLQRGHELTLSTDTSIVIRIDSVKEISLATAKLKRGSIAKIKVGQLFEVSNWVSSDAPLLTVFIPENPFTAADIKKYTDLAKVLKGTKNDKWLNDFEKGDPEVSGYFIGNKFFLKKAGSEPVNADANAGSITKDTEGKSLFFNMPAAKEFTDALKRVFSRNQSIRVVSSAADAQYLLYGTIDEDGKPAYGLMRNQATSKDRFEAMPVQTRHITLAENTETAFLATSDAIFELAKKLAKVNGWLSIIPPADDENKFPFTLQLYDLNAKKVITGTDYKIGDRVTIQLEADSGFADLPFVRQKFVYVFTIDRDGTMTLLYPNRNTGSLESKFPKDNSSTTVRLGTNFTVSKPVGIDSYYMIATETAIPGYAFLFNQQGTKGVPGSRGTANPLANLLNLGNDGGIGTRGPTLETPTTWNLQRKAMKSTY